MLYKHNTNVFSVTYAVIARLPSLFPVPHMAPTMREETPGGSPPTPDND